MAAFHWILLGTALFSLASASVFKHDSKHKLFSSKYNDESDEDAGYGKDVYDKTGKSRNSADAIESVEDLKAAIHNFMIAFEESNQQSPTDQMEIIKKAINNLVLVLVTQSYVHVFKPNLMRNTLAAAAKEAGVSMEHHDTTDEQRAAFIAELAAEAKSLPLTVVNDFVLEYVAADDDNELILKTLIRRKGDDDDVEIQRLKGEVLFSKIIQEMILQSYMTDFDIKPEKDKIKITSSDGTRSRVFHAPPLDTLTKIKLLEAKNSYKKKNSLNYLGEEDGEEVQEGGEEAQEGGEETKVDEKENNID